MYTITSHIKVFSLSVMTSDMSQSWYRSNSQQYCSAEGTP